MKQKRISRRQISYFCVLVCLAVIQVFTNIFKGDDFILIYARHEEQLKKYVMPNGRYVGNALTFMLLESPVLRWILYILLFVTLLMLLSRIVTLLHPQAGAAKWIVLLLFVLMPTVQYQSVVLWLSPYGGYMLSLINLSAFLLLCIRSFRSEPIRHPKAAAALMFLLALAGGLCVEHVTVTAILLGLAMLLLARFDKALRVRAFHWSYLAGAVVAAALMFTNGVYGGIADGVDNAGMRQIEFDFTEIFMKLYSDVVPAFAKHSVLVHIVISLSFLCLYAAAERRGWNPARRRYARLTMGIVLSYACYSVFCELMMNLEPMTWALRLRALEAAFIFLYLISMIYLAYILLPRRDMILTTVYILTAFVLTAPFVIVSPATPRCFFANYVFWILLAGHLCSCAVAGLQLPRVRRAVEGAAAVLAVCGAATVAFVLCENYFVSGLRLSYLREQLAEPKRTTFAILQLPYPRYCSEDFLIMNLVEDSDKFEDKVETIGLGFKEGYGSYQPYFLRYYGLEMPETYSTYEETVMNYYLD